MMMYFRNIYMKIRSNKYIPSYSHRFSEYILCGKDRPQTLLQTNISLHYQLCDAELWRATRADSADKHTRTFFKQHDNHNLCDMFWRGSELS